ncbi:methyltransferase family protein [Frigoriglobus tundricola]|uniref:Uncharacterized protein n=1 Tax=Frigoriglobus tundricola TaxID=2774151 RepID=A0A6M5YW90_9BACT|nr:methyltransferase [Frigoriglobus tundricola]QJW98198.1 hypothetical protein FTUN_5779 [Frigoriglobus tundricola]
MEPLPARDLSLSARLAWFVVNLTLGILPTLLFFAWVEQDTDIPAVAHAFGWPWVELPMESVGEKLIWDAGLFALFAFLHSFFAQVGVQDRVRAVVPAPVVRSFYLAVSGSALFLMMGLWQHTGVKVWRLPLSAEAEAWAAGIVFAIPAVIVLWLVARLGFWDFLGWAQLFGPAAPVVRTAGTPALRTTGIYGHVRHPVYTGLLMMFLLGPTLSLDRLAVFAAALAYLSVGIPVEERKLIRLFGREYAVYRRRVPALLPTGRRVI